MLVPSVHVDCGLTTTCTAFVWSALNHRSAKVTYRSECTRGTCPDTLMLRVGTGFCQNGAAKAVVAYGSIVLAPVQRAPHPQPAPIQHVRVDHRRRHTPVPQEFLHCPDVVTILQQVRRE